MIALQLLWLELPCKYCKMATLHLLAKPHFSFIYGLWSRYTSL